MSSPIVTIEPTTQASLSEFVAATIVDERRATVIATPVPSGRFGGWGPRLPQ